MPQLRKIIAKILQFSFVAPLKSFKNARRIFTNNVLLEESNSNDGKNNPNDKAEKNKEIVKKLDDLIKEMVQVCYLINYLYSVFFPDHFSSYITVTILEQNGIKISFTY